MSQISENPSHDLTWVLCVSLSLSLDDRYDAAQQRQNDTTKPRWCATLSLDDDPLIGGHPAQKEIRGRSARVVGTLPQRNRKYVDRRKVQLLQLGFSAGTRHLVLLFCF